MPVENFVTNELLEKKLEAVLQEWPLYRVLHYTGAQQTRTVPEKISLFCGKCEKETLWETHIYNEDNRRGFTEKQYKCRNCGSRTVTIWE